MTRTTEAVIFDCDGVLVDSEDIANRVMTELLGEADVEMTFEEVVDEFRGREMAFVLETAERLRGGPLPFDLSKRYYESIKAAFENDLRPVPGIVEALQRIDLPNCVASSGPHHKMEVSLRVTGLWDRFEGRIFSAEDVGIGKPAPDLFLHAANAMGFVPATTTVVEDSLPGVRAGVAAGMRVVAYASHTPPDTLRAEGAEPFLDMVELPDLLSADR